MGSRGAGGVQMVTPKRPGIMQFQNGKVDKPGSIATGSAALPLDGDGLAEAKHLGERFAAKGGLHLLISSDLPRASQTAKIIADRTGAKLITTPLLHPWRLGKLEGKPEDDIRDRIVKLAKNNPEEPLRGKSRVSTERGESFHSAVSRTVPTLQFIADLHKLFPQFKIGVVTHSKVIDMALSSRGGKVDVEKMFNHKTQVGDVYDSKGKKVNMDSDEPLNAEIHLIRHGHTPWDKEPSSPSQQ